MDFWTWLEKHEGDDFDALVRQYTLELKPGDQVKYQGGMVNAHGLWVVHAQLDDQRFTLRHPDNEWERLNADRDDIIPVDTEADNR